MKSKNGSDYSDENLWGVESEETPYLQGGITLRHITDLAT